MKVKEKIKLRLEEEAKKCFAKFKILEWRRWFNNLYCVALVSKPSDKKLKEMIEGKDVLAYDTYECIWLVPLYGPIVSSDQYRRDTKWIHRRMQGISYRLASNKLLPICNPLKGEEPF